jgi:L-seryl-tRNA(Ser) seleniumtransferase
VSVEIVPLLSQIGSGSLPVDRLPSAGFAIRPQGKKSGVLHRIEAALRGLPRPVIGRIDNGALLLDLRCLAAEEPRKPNSRRISANSHADRHRRATSTTARPRW